MDFKDTLNKYIDMLGCSARELSEASGISPAVISRYRSSARKPASESPQIKGLADGIAALAKSKGPSSVVRTMKIPEHHMAYPSEMLKILAFARIFLLQNFFFCDIIIVLHSTLYMEVFHGIFFT